MNECDKNIAKRIARGGRLPTAFSPWTNSDLEICGTLTTKPFDYTRRGQIVIFEYEQPTHNKQ